MDIIIKLENTPFVFQSAIHVLVSAVPSLWASFKPLIIVIGQDSLNLCDGSFTIFTGFLAFMTIVQHKYLLVHICKSI